MWDTMTSYARLYIDLQSIVIILLLILLAHKPIVVFVKLLLSKLDNINGQHKVLYDLLINTISNVLAATLIGVVILYFFSLNFKSNLCGSFIAYDVKTIDTTINGEISKQIRKEEWGTVKLNYNLFNSEMQGNLTNKTGEVIVEISARFERGEYLQGYYNEVSNKSRRRMGAFLLMLDGSGRNYKGKYVFTDPEQDNYIPQFGEAEWIKQ